jgi:hypothetical protein
LSRVSRVEESNRRAACGMDLGRGRVRHDCGEKRGGRYFVKSSPSGCGSRAVCAVLWGALLVRRRRCERNNRSHGSRSALRGPGFHVQSLTLYLDGKAKAEREVPGGRYSLAIISYIVSNRELDRALRSDEKVATPQEQELKKEALHLPACIPLMFQRPAPQHTATAERLHLC